MGFIHGVKGKYSGKCWEISQHPGLGTRLHPGTWHPVPGCKELCLLSGHTGRGLSPAMVQCLRIAQVIQGKMNPN